jgi:hypothetical protein
MFFKKKNYLSCYGFRGLNNKEVVKDRVKPKKIIVVIFATNLG